VTAAHEILDERDRLRGPFLGSLALHFGIAASLLISAWLKTRIPAFGAKEAGGSVVGVQAVNSIPLVHHGAPNPLASDTESEVPQTPVTKPKEQVKEEPPPKDAVKLKLKKQKVKPAEVASARQKFRPLDELLPNQLTSRTAPQVSNQAFQVPGAGRMGAGPNNTLGDRFAGYADQIRQIVASHWRTGDVNIRSAPMVIATFELMRDGSIRNVQLLQRSGNPSLDFSVQRAIQESAPFPPIPPGFDRSSASVEFWFELKK